jgi:hypothetical protein
MKFLNKYIFFLLAALLWVNVFCAQTSNLDSLYTDYSKTTNPILKLDKALKLVLEFGNNDQHNRAFSLIKELETSKVDATEINLKKGVILLAKSLLYKTLDSNNASMLNAQLSLQYLVNYKHYYSEAQSMVVMNYFYKGQFDSCIAYGNRVITLKQSKNISSQIDVMLCMGRSYDFIGDRKKGVALTLEAIEIAKGNDKV